MSIMEKAGGSLTYVRLSGQNAAASTTLHQGFGGRRADFGAAHGHLLPGYAAGGAGPLDHRNDRLGKRSDLSSLPKPTVDKHSTAGSVTR